MILSRTLAEVNPETGELDELLITIPSCGHAFTVETLDGLTGIKNFYTRNVEDTKWIGLQTPEGFIPRPTCPLCRSPISSSRYGRIIKRADLDILERNVAAHMFQSIEICSNTVRNFDEDRAKTVLLTQASQLSIPKQEDMPLEKTMKKMKKNREAILKNVKETPVSLDDIRAENKHLHFIDSAVCSAWRNATYPLFKSYGEIVKLAETRSAHTQAWEASFSFLYEHEIQIGLENPAMMPKRPEEHAMRMATLQVGQPRPLADRRTVVEAFWRSLHIRLTLVKLARIWLDALHNQQNRYPSFHQHQWADYISFLLSVCASDTEKALQVAQESKAHRQIIQTVVLGMRVDLEAFRFNLEMCKTSGAFKNQEVRESLRLKAFEKAGMEEEALKTAIKQYFIHRKHSKEERAWVTENFTNTAQSIIGEWNKIEKSIRLDTFYQPVSLEEKEEIFRAFNFGN